MRTVILAGGLGSRLGEETAVRPKPMVEIGGMPILWHIMKIYSAAGLNDFVICLGYKGYLIKEFFANYFLHTADVTIDLNRNDLEIHQARSEPWRITLVETGATAMTGGRLKAIKPYLEPGEPFCFTYGDGVASIDVADLVRFHRAHGRRATITSVAPPGRFGALEFEGDRVTSFREKPAGDGGQINGGFFVADPSVLDLIDGPDTTWEAEPLERLANAGELVAYRHDGFWQPMDTLRDKQYLESLWQSGEAPWKCW
ncbi:MULTISPECIES: glucose-1-phosphate cytidylyltransferase [Sphingomonadales]|uniref:Glucose-1-phosphate cytidylyltransferase n=1 Tax=Edaphosphingomonas haloaromaticamans TaxID=653954 RepID=A0A1S1H803_9SPHN|nr:MULTISPECIES: glucose-1-phosphate cytidylyltransferase [Sphingomonas]MDX3883843.1 glucose-1-phosphate cytidylyltransferase [Sphingomonas sp.]OHT18214.1 Glucose-1-phosphate cytidylyltransferase [Sphingomonas haloaromaticamans]